MAPLDAGEAVGIVFLFLEGANDCLIPPWSFCVAEYWAATRSDYALQLLIPAALFGNGRARVILWLDRWAVWRRSDAMSLADLRFMRQTVLRGASI